MAEVCYGLSGAALERKAVLMNDIKIRGWECTVEQEQAIDEILHEYITDELAFEDAVYQLDKLETLDRWIEVFNRPYWPED